MTKRIFDEKMKRMLSGMLPFSPFAHVTWTPEEFFPFPIDLQPKFNLRPLSKELIDDIRSEIQLSKFDISTAKRAVIYSVTGWSDVIDLGTESEIPFSVENINQLPENLIWIIYKKINEMTFGLSETEKESLESQRRQESGPSFKAAESAD